MTIKEEVKNLIENNLYMSDIDGNFDSRLLSFTLTKESKNQLENDLEVLLNKVEKEARDIKLDNVVEFAISQLTINGRKLTIELDILKQLKARVRFEFNSKSN